MRTLWTIAAGLALLLIAAPAPAAVLYWIGPASGGTWDNTTPNWNTAADGSGTTCAWNDPTYGQDVAYFPKTPIGGGGTFTAVILSGTINANGITIDNTAGNVTLTGGTLNLTGAAAVAVNGSTTKLYLGTYNSAAGFSLTGTNGLNTSQSGWVFLSGTNSFSGPTSMLNGSVFDICTNVAWPSNLPLNPTSPGCKVRIENNFSATCAGLTGNGNLTGQGAGNCTLTMSRNDGSTYTYTGTIGEVRLHLVKQGNYTQVLAGTAANDNKGATVTVQGGVLALAKTPGVTAIGSATVTTPQTSIVISGGALRLDASNQIHDLVPMTLSGGTFNANGFSETLAALTVTADSTIDFGAAGSILQFASGAQTSGVLSVLNWEGDFAGGGADQLRFTTDPGDAFLAAVQFDGYGLGEALSLDMGGWFEIVPKQVQPQEIPEPASAILLTSGAAALGVRRRRR